MTCRWEMHVSLLWHRAWQTENMQSVLTIILAWVTRIWLLCLPHTLNSRWHSQTKISVILTYDSCLIFCRLSILSLWDGPTLEGETLGAGTSIQVDLHIVAVRKTSSNFHQLPLFLWVYFSSLSLIPDGSLAHKNNPNPSTVVRQPALWKWGE